MTIIAELPTVSAMNTAMTTITETDVDSAATAEFAERLLGIFTGSMLTYLIDLGRRVGLFEALAAGPGTSAEIAHRAGLQERYVREWLAAMASGAIVEYAPSDGRFWLPTEHAASLIGDGIENLAPMAYLMTALGAHVPAVAHAFRFGGGVPYEAFLPELRDVMDTLWRPIYERLVTTEVLPLAPGLVAHLEAGARVGEVACGTGTVSIELARAFPRSSFLAIDSDAGAIALAGEQASSRRLTNVSFSVVDAARWRVDAPLDAVLIFNAMHDQAAPVEVLNRMFEALAPGGVLLMDEPAMSADLADNLTQTTAAFTYGISTLHCLTTSLAAGGAGLGTVWGWQTASRLLAEAGFEETQMYEAPGDPFNAVFIARKPSGLTRAG
jgi:SAM-dependent methyltransferase